MPGSTSRGYPYPLGPEQALGSTDIQGLAEAVDADVSSLIPAGTIWAWAGDTAPAGWQLCNGALLARSEFSRLFATIGTKYGEGDGVSTFATPNLEGKVIVAAGGGYALNATGGSATHTLSAAEMPSHTHSVSDPGHAHNFFYQSAASGYGYSGTINLNGGIQFIAGTDNHGYPPGITIQASGTGISVNAAGSGTAHNNMQPYLVLNYIIKL